MNHIIIPLWIAIPLCLVIAAFIVSVMLYYVYRYEFMDDDIGMSYSEFTSLSERKPGFFRRDRIGNPAPYCALTDVGGRDRKHYIYMNTYASWIRYNAHTLWLDRKGERDRQEELLRTVKELCE